MAWHLLLHAAWFAFLCRRAFSGVAGDSWTVSPREGAPRACRECAPRMETPGTETYMKRGRDLHEAGQRRTHQRLESLCFLFAGFYQFHWADAQLVVQRTQTPQLLGLLR